MHHIRPALTEDMAKTIACALVGARLDYANSVPVGVKTKNVARLQRAQNAVARVFALGTNRQLTNSSALLKHYHWLPIHLRIKTFGFKAFKVNQRMTTSGKLNAEREEA